MRWLDGITDSMEMSLSLVVNKTSLYEETNENINDYTTSIGYENNSNNFNFTPNLKGSIIIVLISLVLAFLIFFTFVKSSKELKGKFTNWLREFLNFRNILIENILKFTYLFLSILITILSFTLIKDSITEFLALLLLGNFILRLSFELTIMFIMVWKNTSDINMHAKEIKNKIEKQEKPNNYYENKKETNTEEYL